MTKPIVGGRPLKFENIKEMISRINKYFEETEAMEFTITGLCLSIGTNKQVLLDYQKRPGYKEIVEEAKLIVENSYELSLRNNGKAGDIFALKNFGWKDQQQIDHGITEKLADHSERLAAARNRKAKE